MLNVRILLLNVRIPMLNMRILMLNAAEPELDSVPAASSQTPVSPWPCPSLPGARTCSEPFGTACSQATSPLQAAQPGKAPKAGECRGGTSAVLDPLLQPREPTLAPRFGADSSAPAASAGRRGQHGVTPV